MLALLQPGEHERAAALLLDDSNGGLGALVSLSDCHGDQESSETMCVRVKRTKGGLLGQADVRNLELENVMHGLHSSIE